MTSLLLILNAGSSSIKFAAFEAREPPRRLLTGQIDAIGTAALFKAKGAGGEGLDEPAWKSGQGPKNHVGALDTILTFLQKTLPDGHIQLVGHRVVHGGPDLGAPTLVDDALIARLADLVPLAPLHQPHNIAGIAAARKIFPAAVQVACFDTNFHRGRSFPDDAYAIPRLYYEAGVRRYGFHGISYDYVWRRLVTNEPAMAERRAIIAHLGNGASACLVKAGRSLASTMGFTPLDGLIMGTRPGQIDPGVLLWLMQARGMDGQAISDLLYRHSGLIALSGMSNDMRTLEASSEPAAAQAIAAFVQRLAREIASLAAIDNGFDALVFTGGIGENSAAVRGAVMERLAFLGVRFVPALNAAAALVLSPADAAIASYVIPTDEEAMMAHYTLELAAQRTSP
jgi:acetate kinase